MRKKLIISLMVIITILFIVVIGTIIKKDNSETRKQRLDFYSNYFDIQLDIIQLNYYKNTEIAYSFINTNPEIKKLLKQYNNSFSSAIKNELKFNTLIIKNNLKPSGITDLKLHIVADSSNIENSVILTSNLKNPKYNHQDSTKNSLQLKHGFVATETFTGLIYSFPIFIDNNEIAAIVEVFFSFDHLINEISTITDNNNIGLLYVQQKNDEMNSQWILEKFKKCKIADNYLINSEFLTTNDLENNNKAQQFIRNELQKKSNHNFSTFLKTHKKSSVLTLTELRSFDSKNRFFLIAINNDTVLDKAQQLNNSTLLINIFIVLFGMIGITYLIINRFNIIQQKQRIQKSEQKLLELNQSKDKFFSIVAHDLKNPFNGIMGMSGYLSTEYENVSDEERKEIITDINISSKNAFNLLQNLLEWTRAQSGTIRNYPCIIDPNKTIELALETVTNLAKIKQIEIVKNITTNQWGWADENLVATVIRNLTTNAIKFSPRNTEVEILVKEFGSELVFCVSDKGIGLREDEIDKLFRIDINFHKLGTEKEKGSGLGLKLCKEFVEYCGGKIWVISEANEGSSFYFTIPLYNAQNNGAN